MSDTSVSLGLDSSNFEGGLQRATGLLGRFRSSASSAFGGLKGLVGGAAIVGTIKSIADEMGHVRDLSDRLGETPETIQRIGQVAKESGSDIETIVKAMSKLTIEANEGGEGFAKIGIDAQSFLQMPLEEKLIALADASDRAGNDASKQADIMKLLGNRAGELIPMLNAGGSALRDMFADVSPASAAAVEAIDDAGDRLDRLFQNLRVWGANAINFIISRTEALGVAAVGAYRVMSALMDGEDPGKAWNEAMQGGGMMYADRTAESEERQDRNKKSAGRLARDGAAPPPAAGSGRNSSERDSADDSRTLADHQREISREYMTQRGVLKSLQDERLIQTERNSAEAARLRKEYGAGSDALKKAYSEQQKGIDALEEQIKKQKILVGLQTPKERQDEKREKKKTAQILRSQDRKEKDEENRRSNGAYAKSPDAYDHAPQRNSTSHTFNPIFGRKKKGETDTVEEVGKAMNLKGEPPGGGGESKKGADASSQILSELQAIRSAIDAFDMGAGG